MTISTKSVVLERDRARRTGGAQLVDELGAENC
jgi:hypothetical protein